MAKLLKRELDIVKEEIYNKVTIPAIEHNNDVINNFKVPSNNQYIKDFIKYQQLDAKRLELSLQMESLQQVYSKVKTDKFVFPAYYDVFSKFTVETYKKSLIDPKLFNKTYSKSDIEREIILAGNKDIPELIESIINKLK
jgi:hypothetical protein